MREISLRSIALCFFLLCLSSISPLQAQSTETEPNQFYTQADTLAVGSPIQASLSPNDLLDIFVFYAESNRMYSTTSFCDYQNYDLSGLAADVFFVGDTLHSVLLGNPSGRYGKFGFRLAGWVPPQTGWYFLRLSVAAFASGGIEYAVRIPYATPLSEAGTFHENDDTFTNANSQAPVPTDGTFVHGYLYKNLGAYNWNDVDLFRFEANAGQRLVAETFTPAIETEEPWFIRDTDTEIALLDQNGVETGYFNDDKEITAADPWETTLNLNNTFSRIVVENLPHTGVYYVRVSSYYNSLFRSENPDLSDANPGGGEYLLSVNLGAEASSRVDFTIQNEYGLLMPGKLTAVGIPGTQTQGTYKFLHTITGKGTLLLPPGDYRLWFSHGLEYSLVEQSLSLSEGEAPSVTARLRREIDTEGYICGDFHLHILEGIDSPDKAGIMLTALVAEGVEFAAASDHNAVSDYRPRAQELCLLNWIKTVPSDEISTSWGHFNAWPLPSGGPPVLSTGTPAEMFADARRLGAKIIQVNHPRWTGIDYFTQAGLDTETGLFTNPLASLDFDAVELMNETEGWGFQVQPPNNPISVVKDWFNLLNRGKRACAVGNSDAHGINGDKPGYPRNYIASPTDKPGEAEIDDLCEAILRCRVTVCDGHFTTFTINEIGHIGDLVHDTDGTVDMAIRVQALSQIAVDTVTIYGNGRQVAQFLVPPTDQVDKFHQTLQLHPVRDTWYMIISSGGQTIPIGLIQDDGGPIRPIGYTNPIWVDVDGNGRFDFDKEPDKVVSKDESVPGQTFLAQNYPNPFNAATSFILHLEQAGHASVIVYSLAGEQVAALIEGRMAAGEHKIQWDASGLPSGLYVIKMQAGNSVQVRKALLLR